VAERQESHADPHQRDGDEPWAPGRDRRETLTDAGSLVIDLEGVLGHQADGARDATWTFLRTIDRVVVESRLWSGHPRIMGRFGKATGGSQARHHRALVFWCGDPTSPAHAATALMSETTVLDLSGSEELCSEPGALERVRKAYARLEPGGRLEVRSPVAEHAFAVRAWSRKNGVGLVVDEPSEGYRRLVLAAPAANG
jgi:TusA-related sulfurtransferase